jgi:hypothetical protein
MTIKSKNILKTSALLAVLVAGVTTLGVGCACHRPPPEGHPDGMTGGPHMKQHRPPPLPGPLLRALDVNRDGILDADEIAKASSSLKTLDTNGDGRLTADELRPLHLANQRDWEADKN